MRRANFFDRDGILNREIGNYVCKVEDFELLTDAVECIQIAKKSGFMVFIITNQGGIAKKLYTHEDLKIFHHKILNATDFKVDEIFYCHHHPEISNCICRKPDSLMLEKAIAKYQLDKKKCFMIGDTPRDIQAAEKAGIKGLLVQPNSDKIHLLKEQITIILNN